jgi:hypothetical protein
MLISGGGRAQPGCAAANDQHVPNSHSAANINIPYLPNRPLKPAIAMPLNIRLSICLPTRHLQWNASAPNCADFAPSLIAATSCSMYFGGLNAISPSSFAISAPTTK